MAKQRTKKQVKAETTLSDLYKVLSDAGDETPSDFLGRALKAKNQKNEKNQKPKLQEHGKQFRSILRRLKKTDSLFAVPLKRYPKRASDLTGLEQVVAQSIEKVDGWEFVFGELSKMDCEPLPDEDEDSWYFDREIEEGDPELEGCHLPDGSRDDSYAFYNLSNYLKLSSFEDGGAILVSGWDSEKMWHKHDTTPGEYDTYGEGYCRGLCYNGYILIAFRTSEKVKYQGESPFARHPSKPKKTEGEEPASKKHRRK